MLGDTIRWALGIKPKESIFNTTISDKDIPPMPTVKELASSFEKIKSSHIPDFKGIPTIIDCNLKGKKYYIAISQELADDLLVNGKKE